MADAGIGEAMLLSAAIGGGSAAITGGDPLKGALLGGLTGGLGAGIGPMMSGVMPGAAPVLVEGAGAAGGAGIGALPSGGVMSAIDAGGFNPANLPAPGSFANSAIDAGGFNPANLPAPGEAMSSIDAGGFNPANLPTQPVSTFQQAMNDPLKYMNEHRFMMANAALTGATGARYKPNFPGADTDSGPLKKFRYDPSTYMPSRPYAEGGITSLGGGNMVVGGNPLTDPNQNNSFEASSFPVSYMAGGGISDLGSYSDGGRMLEGPGDGMSDSIPASIAGKRPARLAQGEFVVPADVVSHLGNGSTDAGAKQLYHMMDKVRQARTGRRSQGREINPGKYMPA